MSNHLEEIETYVRPALTAGARDVVVALEQQLRTMPQVDLAATTQHYFVESPLGRLYARELHAPVGMAMTGKVHRFENLNVLVKGRVRMLADNEIGYEDITAPLTIVSPPGTKRAGLFLEDSIWITICPTTAATVEEAETQLVVDSYEAFDAQQLQEITT